VALIRTSTKNELIGELKDVTLECLIEQGWDKYLRLVIELIKPKAIVSNSRDLSFFLERNNCPNKDCDVKDAISINFNNERIPVMLSGQVRGQRAIDKWTLERMKRAIVEIFTESVISSAEIKTGRRHWSAS
jgi:hypothetical protein